MMTATQILVILFFGQALGRYSTLDDGNKCSENELKKCVVNYNQYTKYFMGDESCSELPKTRECVKRFETTCGWTDLLEIAVEDIDKFKSMEVNCGFYVSRYNGDSRRRSWYRWEKTKYSANSVFSKAEPEAQICFNKHFNFSNPTCPELKKLETCVGAIVAVTELDHLALKVHVGTVESMLTIC